MLYIQYNNGVGREINDYVDNWEANFEDEYAEKYTVFRPELANGRRRPVVEAMRLFVNGIDTNSIEGKKWRTAAQEASGYF